MYKVSKTMSMVKQNKENFYHKKVSERDWVENFEK